MSHSWLPPRIVLVGVRNPLNIGAAARAMANFGLRDLVLVRPYQEAWKTAASARAGLKVLAQARVVATLDAALESIVWAAATSDLRRRKPEIPALDWPHGLQACDLAAPWALLFGSEKSGLGVEEMSYCRTVFRLPTWPDSPSMNLGQAVAVCAYELRRLQSNPVEPQPANDSADLTQRERIVESFLPILETIGVFRPQHRASQQRRLRSMLARWNLTPGDARLLLGVGRECRRTLKIN